MDWNLIHQSLHGIASQALLEGTLHGRDGKPVDSEAINQRVNETLNLIRSEIAAEQLEGSIDATIG
nr:hypothetical protein [uncultured Ruegeria sp.]